MKAPVICWLLGLVLILGGSTSCDSPPSEAHSPKIIPEQQTSPPKEPVKEKPDLKAFNQLIVSYPSINVPFQTCKYSAKTGMTWNAGYLKFNDKISGIPLTAEAAKTFLPTVFEQLSTKATPAYYAIGKIYRGKHLLLISLLSTPEATTGGLEYWVSVFTKQGGRIDQHLLSMSSADLNSEPYICGRIDANFQLTTLADPEGKAATGGQVEQKYQLSTNGKWEVP